MAKQCVIATPILSPRAGDALRECDLVCVGNARASAKPLTVGGRK